MKYLKKFNENVKSKRFIWIHGLPGSGKSTIANKIVMDNPDENYVLLDDVGSLNKVSDEIDKGSNIILNSPYFDNYMMFDLDKKLRDILSNNLDYLVDEIWFENNPNKCIENIKNRKNHKIAPEILFGEIQNFSINYKIPIGVKTIPVF